MFAYLLFIIGLTINTSINRHEEWHFTFLPHPSVFTKSAVQPQRLLVADVWLEYLAKLFAQSNGFDVLKFNEARALLEIHK